MMSSSAIAEAPTSETDFSHPWDRAAQGWNDHRSVIRQWLRDATRMMLDAAHVQAHCRVLDIAAGAGDQTLDIAQRVGDAGFVLATDISTRILELAAQNARAAGFSHVETRIADAQSLGLAGANFDAAVCRLGLMFCNAPHHAFNSAREALKSGGRFSALVFAGPQGNACLERIMATALKHAGVAAQSPFKPGSLMSLGQSGLLAELLNHSGFIDVDVQRVSAPFHLPSAQHYIDFVRSAGSPVMQLLASLTVAQQSAAWDEMSSVLNAFNTVNGWVGPHELLLCVATAQ
jgi:ubiquinone/menaquinone biosynthesis C-methylase UbiE